MLASVLSSTGALMELQAPCLSGTVLALVLDYIYTGALPRSQQQYYRLLSAASYLQMDELHESLRTEVNENQSCKYINKMLSQPVNTFSKYLPSLDTGVNSLDREDYYCDETDAQSCANHCGRKDASHFSIVNTSCSVPESTRSDVNTLNCRQVIYLTPQDMIQNIPCTAEVHRVSRVDKEVQKDQFHSSGIVKYESCQMSTKEELVGTAEKINANKEGKIHHSSPLCLLTSHLKDNVSLSQCSSSSPQPCYEAVPVIRHSSTAALAEVSTVPSYHPVSQASVTSSRTSDSPPGSTDKDRITEGITTKHKNHYEPQNEDYRNNKDHTETQSLDYKDSSMRTYQCAIQDLYHKSSADQSGTLKQDYNSNNTEHDEHMDNGLSHNADDNDHHAHCDSFQNKINTKHLMEESVPPYKDASGFTRGLKNKTDFIFDDLPPKDERLDCSDCSNVSIATVAGQRAVVPLPLQETGSDSHYEDLCLEKEAKEEPSYSSRCPAEMDKQDSHCNLYGPNIESYPILHGAEMTAKDAVSSQHEQLNNSTGRTSLEHENISGTEFSKQHLTFPVPMDISDPSYNVVGQSYRGLLNYHCLPQEDTHLSHGDYDHKHYSHLDYSDQSSGEEVVGTFASSGLSALRQHFAATDQVVLLDISTKPAELLVSYRHRTDEGEKWVTFSQKDRFGNRFGENDREQQHEATRVNKSKVNATTKFGADEVETKLWVGETNVKERRIVTEEQSRPRAEVIHKAGHVEAEDQTATLTCCSSPSVPDSVQARVSTTLSVSIPSTLSASMPTNISAHLSTPVHHPFQCSLCVRSFSQRGSLNRHVRSHLGVRPFSCPRCPMTFSRQYRVSEHMRVHQRCVLGSDFQKKPASSV